MLTASHRTTQGARSALLVALTLLAACEPATGPGAEGSLDTRAALADHKAMQDVFTTRSWSGLQALAGRTPVAAQSTVAAMQAVPALATSGTGTSWAFRMLRDMSGAHRTSDLARTVISPTHLGKTFVYEASTDRYVIDPKRAGAPANGTRFITYEVGESGRPIPGREIGYADLRDEGATSGETVVLRLTVVERGTTVIDYRTRALLRERDGEIGVDGYAQDAQGARLTFSVDVAARTTGGETRIDADFELALSPRGFSAIGAVRGIKEGDGGDGEITLTLRHASNSLAVALADTRGALTGRILVDDKLFVNVSGTREAPVVRGPAGETLNESQLELVDAIVKMSDDVFDLVEDLVKPVEHLLLLGWLL